jgi:hypothetical protein
MEQFSKHRSLIISTDDGTLNAFIDLYPENAASPISVNLVPLSKDNSVSPSSLRGGNVSLKAPAAITSTTAGITTVFVGDIFPKRMREFAEKRKPPVTERGDFTNGQTSRGKAEGCISFTVAGRITLSRGTLANAPS